MLRSAIVILFAPLLLDPQPRRAPATETVLTGNLERVGPETLSLRLPDGTSVDARLPAAGSVSFQSLAAQYHLGDRVEVIGKPIRAAWAEETAWYVFLEVAGIRQLRPASPAELSLLLSPRPWRREPNLLQPPSRPAPEPAATPPPADSMPPAVADTLAKARTVNLAFAATMPDFIATEIVERYNSPPGATGWKHFDTIQSEVAVVRGRATRQNILKDGRPWNQPFQTLPFFKPSGSFGTEIGPIFDPACPTAFEYGDTRLTEGLQVTSYTLDAPADSCFFPMWSTYHPENPAGFERFNPPRRGRVLVENSNGRLLQSEIEERQFPEGFGLEYWKEATTWNSINIGDASYRLPVAVEIEVGFGGGMRGRWDAHYKDFRHFQVSSIFH
jgi:hypothetical protein